MRILFMGTPDIAAECLKALYAAGHDICAVYTRRDKPVGRKQVLTAPPVKEVALAHGTPVFQPRTLRDGSEDENIRALAPELIVVVAYGCILPKSVLEMPRYGCINLHVSLLPKYRGSAPVQWSVLNGDAETGVSIMQMDEGLDTGDVLYCKKIAIDPEETSGELFDRVTAVGAEALCETIPQIAAGTLTAVPQDHENATLAPMLNKEMAEFHLTDSAAHIHNWVRGMNPWPGAWFITSGGKKLKVMSCRVVFAAGEGVLTLVDSLVMGCAVLIVISTQISWELTLLALLPMPLMALAINRYGEQLHERFKLAQAAFSSLNDRTQESMTSIRMIKAFGLEDRQSALFAADAADTGAKNMRVARIDARFDPTIYIAIGMANLLAVGGGSWMVVQGTMTLGQLTSFAMYLGLMIWPMLALAWMFNIVERGSAAYSRIRAMLAEVPVVNDGSEPVSEGPGILKADIRAFIYPQTEHPVLENVSFTLRPGQMLGICGPTGSGKSTILSLIQRHFDVSEGDIRFHDVPLPRLLLDDWRSRLAVVSQTPFLFSDTIANNIALGCPTATQDQIEHVARLASVHEDILRLPQGYDTEVGERGVMLSGGQKQRISIARALLLDAEILILDDALSAVDGRTEHQILHNLRQWGEGRTVIISAHRLSALTEASEILVLQHGHIAQRGQHEQLAGQTGWYRDMYRYQQLEAALDEEVADA